MLFFTANCLATFQYSKRVCILALQNVCLHFGSKIISFGFVTLFHQYCDIHLFLPKHNLAAGSPGGSGALSNHKYRNKKQPSTVSNRRIF